MQRSYCTFSPQRARTEGSSCGPTSGLSCLEKGVADSLLIRRQRGREEHRLRERSRLTQLYVKTIRWHVLLESGRESSLACSPPRRAISRLEGRLVVQANDERWRANLVSRVTLAKLKQRPPRQDGELRLADDREMLLIKQLL